MLDRPDPKRLLADARPGAFDVVLVCRRDLLARSRELVHEIFDRLQQADVSLRTAADPFETIAAGGRLMMKLLATFAEFGGCTQQR